MLPKWHVLLGIIFSIIVYFLFDLTIFQSSLIFLASVFVDFDHYFFYVIRFKSFNLKKAYIWHKKLPIKHKPVMHIFHSIEFLILLIFLSFAWIGFLFIFIGIIFHSILDLLEMWHEGYLGRELSLIRYLILIKNNPNKYF